ncbi:hypothetical protein ElyMa_001168100 [Elysia marginata]|uniref:Uncharacterized protein n=1 Tax=Elysia marginata TaxID=1093978 RepID=A0AAV4I136_9GAST|nr:hypothetical protein ElyMa_001168100 [Elysia marginata]
MAEIRIPTDRIPADILHRLQAIGHSIIFPGSNTTPPPQSSSSALAAAATTTTTSNASSDAAGVSSVADQARAVYHCSHFLQDETQRILRGQLSKAEETMTHQKLPFPAASSSSTPTPHMAAAASSTSPPTSSSTSLLPTPKSSLSSYPSTSSSPPLLGPFSSPPGPAPGDRSSGFPGHLDMFSPHTGMSVSPGHDETDGQTPQTNQDSIVHALDLNKHRKRGGHPVDESDIVRIFPMNEDEEHDTHGQEEPDNIPNNVERPSEIVRVFQQEEQELLLSQNKRASSTPTKRFFSSSRHHNKGSSSINSKGNSIGASSENTNVFNHQPPCVQQSPQVQALSAGSVVPHVLSEPPVFTLGEDDSEDFAAGEETFTRQRRPLATPNSTPSKSKPVGSSETTPKHQRQCTSNAGYGFTNSARLTPPVSAIARRSPGGLVTPPMTPDDMGEDEVFSYDLSRDDSLPLSNRRALDRRHSDLSIELRQLKHAHLYPHHAHSSGSAPPKCSPFSPAQRLSELTFGDRQQTRKRLSFEDCEEEKSCRRPGDSSSIEVVQSSSRNTVDSFSPLLESSATSSLRASYNSEPMLTHYQHHSNTVRNNDSIRTKNCNSSSSFVDTIQPTKRIQHLKSQTYRPRPSKSVSPSLKSHRSPSSHPGTQSEDSRADYNTSPLSHAYLQPQAPPPSPSQPMGDQYMDSPLRGAMPQAHHMIYSSRALPRGRLHSEGDDVTSEVSSATLGRPRGQTFSHVKRRRLDNPDAANDTRPFTMQQQQQERQLQQRQQQQQEQQQQQQHQRQQQYQQQHTVLRQEQQQTNQQRSHTPPSPQAQHTQSSPPCACATIERDFLQVAESAYKRIRRLDNTPGDFDRFRQEMAQTNDMLKEWLLVMGNIRTICCHAPSTSKQQADTPPVTSAPLPSSTPFSSSCSSSFSSLPLPSPLPSSLPSIQASTSSVPQVTVSSSSSAYSTSSLLHQRHQQAACMSSSSSSSSSLVSTSLPAQLTSMASRDFINPSDDIDDDLNDHDNSESVFHRRFLV